MRDQIARVKGSVMLSDKTEKTIFGITGALALIGGAAALSYKAMNLLMTEAMDRHEPEAVSKMKDKLEGYVMDPELLATLKKAKADLEARVTETVEMESFDGTHLVAHWYPAENPKRTLICMHGWRSSWSSDFGVIAPFWHENGCNLLLCEQRAQGESAGEHMSFGMMECRDCCAWGHWLNVNKPSVLPMYLAGVSMGATTVLMAAGLEELPENIHGILADCGFTSPDAIWKHVMQDNLKLLYSPQRPVIDALCKQRINMESDSWTAPESLKRAKVPVIFAHGTDDTFVPVEMTYENYKACASEKRLFIVPGADHGMSYLVDRKGYEENNLRFFRDFD